MTKYYAVVFMGNPHCATGKMREYSDGIPVSRHEPSVCDYGGHQNRAIFTDIDKARQIWKAFNSSFWAGFYEIVEVEH